MILLEWNTNLAVHIPEIDEQHKKLIALLNRSYVAVKQNEDQEAEKIIAELLDYAIFHFTAEEKLMKENHYIHYENHKQQHLEFLEELGKIHEKRRQKNPTALIDLFRFLNDWLVNHIIGMDQKVGYFLNSR